MLVDMGRHAHEVDELWEDYRQQRNQRVPVYFACDEQVWLRASGHTFHQFYHDPRVHLWAQLKGKKWFSENVVGDMSPGGSQRWDVIVRLWMEEDEFFGCEVAYQEDDYAWAKPLPLSRRDLLAHLRDLDPEDRVKKSKLFWMYQALLELTDGLEFEGKPVVVTPPGRGTHGIFTKAAEIRGLEQMCMDMYEAPGFAEEYLRLVTEKTIGRIKVWRDLTGCTDKLPMRQPWGFADDSLQMISAHLYERFVLPCHELLFASMTTGARSVHLCGRACQHYEVLHRRLGVTTIDGPGTFVDHARYLRDFGPDFTMNAQTDNAILERGSAADIEHMMRGLLSPGAKLAGRFNIAGFISRETPLANASYCYGVGRELGLIPSTSQSQ